MLAVNLACHSGRLRYIENSHCMELKTNLLSAPRRQPACSMIARQLVDGKILRPDFPITCKLKCCRKCPPVRVSFKAIRTHSATGAKSMEVRFMSIRSGGPAVESTTSPNKIHSSESPRHSPECTSRRSRPFQPALKAYPK